MELHEDPLAWAESIVDNIAIEMNVDGAVLDARARSLKEENVVVAEPTPEVQAEQVSHLRRIGGSILKAIEYVGTITAWRAPGFVMAEVFKPRSV